MTYGEFYLVTVVTKRLAHAPASGTLLVGIAISVALSTTASRWMTSKDASHVSVISAAHGTTTVISSLVNASAGLM